MDFVSIKSKQEGYMKRLFTGILIIGLFIIAILTGGIAVINDSLLFSIVYAVLLLPSFLMIIYSYCSKCPCRRSYCVHIVPGIITKYLPKRIQGKYHFWDYFGMLSGFGIIIIFPQYWLLKNIHQFAIFWLTLVIAGLTVFNIVCKLCKNNNCLLRNKKK